MDDGPNAIDPASGFKVKHRDLVRQWDGEWVHRRFVDKRNPQDFVKGRKDKMTIDHPRPEAPDQFFAEPLLWESGVVIELEGGGVILGQSGLLRTL